MFRMTLMEGAENAEDVFSLVKSGNSKALAALLQTKSAPLDELNAADKNGRVSIIQHSKFYFWHYYDSIL